MFSLQRALVSEATGLRYQGEAWGALPVVRCVGSTREGVSAKVRRASPSGGSSAGLDLLTSRLGGEIRTPNTRRVFDVSGFRASVWRNEGNRREPK